MAFESLKFLVCLCLIIFGVAIFIKADTASQILKKFYSQYPVFKYAGDKQLSNRPIFIKAFGVIVVLLALIMFFG